MNSEAAISWIVPSPSMSGKLHPADDLIFSLSFILPSTTLLIYHIYTSMDMTIGAAYKCQIGAEPLQKYCPGGYHPTHIGDKYADGRYEIVHKLGSGTYSTVWLAKDHIANKLVALKILVANSITKTSEAETLRELAAGNDAHEGKRSVAALLDEFIVDGPNGRHRCLVLEVVGCSLYRSRRASPSTQFPLGIARAIAMELILGVDYIHSCGRVHGGR